MIRPYIGAEKWNGVLVRIKKYIVEEHNNYDMKDWGVKG